MNTGIRRVGIVMIILFVGLVAQLTYLQVGRATRLDNDPRNVRKFLRDIQRNRGPIVSGDGVILAKSVPSNDEYKYQRVYPDATAGLFAHVVGYQSIQFGSVGVENTYSADLAGRTFKLQLGNFADRFATTQPVGTVDLTLADAVQKVAAFALRGQKGSVVALDVQTGGVLAMFSNATFNPNPLASHNTAKARKARADLLKDPANPLLARGVAGDLPARLDVQDRDRFDRAPAQRRRHHGVPATARAPPPADDCHAAQLRQRALRGNTRRGLHRVVQHRVRAGRPRPRRHPRIKYPAVRRPDCATALGSQSVDRGEHRAEGRLVRSEQTVVRVRGHRSADRRHDPARDGTRRGIGRNRRRHLRAPRHGLHQGSAGQHREAQLDRRILPRDGCADRRPDEDLHAGRGQRSARGTGSAAWIPGVLVAGKTGTAETAPGQPPHAWFIAFAPVDHPRYAVAVLVEHGGADGQNAEATGGRVAAPIAKAVLQAALALPATPSQCGTGK